MPIRYLLGPDARTSALERALRDHARIGITGAPNTGKTILAELVTDREVVPTDRWKDDPWESQPASVIEACAPLERFVVEGVQVPRALRKGLDLDCLIYLAKPMAEQTPKQIATGKGVATVFESIREKLTIPVFVCP